MEEEITTINNWACFGARSVMIVLNKFNFEDETFYQPSLSIQLDDGNPPSDSYKQEKNIDILLDYYDECPIEATRRAVKGIRSIFAHIANLVMIIDETGKLSEDEDLLLSDIMSKNDGEDEDSTPNLVSTVH